MSTLSQTARRAVDVSAEGKGSACTPTSESNILTVIGSLDEKIKTTFTEAWAKHRDLVKRETPFYRFIQADKGNIELAARRLVGYWENRKDLFGERVFFPMVLDREQERGALAYEDIEILETGFNAFLPDTGNGSPTLLYNLSRLEKEMKDGKGKHRCNFYLLHVASEDEKSRSVGITILRYTGGTTFYPNIQHFVAFLRTMPIIVKSIEWVIYQQPEESRRMVEETIIPIRKCTIPEDFQHLLHMHTSDNIQDVKRSLTKAGFSLPGLPDYLGGTTKHEDLIRFDLKSTVPVAKDLDEKECPTDTSLNSMASKHSRKRSLPGAPSIAEKSRKQRTKEKKNLEALVSEATDLQSENRFLKQEASYLEGLVLAAKAEVTKFLQTNSSCSGPAEITGRLRSPSQGRLPVHFGIGGADSGQPHTPHFQSPGFNAESLSRHGLLPTIPSQTPLLSQDSGQTGLPTSSSSDLPLLSRFLRTGSGAAPVGQRQAALNIDPAALLLLVEMQRRNVSL